MSHITVGEILSFLDRISPFELQEKWDNCGLNVGRESQKISEVAVSLEVTFDLVQSLSEGTLLITHHPLIFAPLKLIDCDERVGKIIELMIKKNIPHIAMHTNIDKTHLNRYVAQNVLGWKEFVCENFVCTCSYEGDFETLVTEVKKAFSLDKCVVVAPLKKISKLALTTGSGGSFIEKSDADVYITGDLKYHEALSAQEKGMGVIDITHHASESFFPYCLIDELKTLPINVTIRTTNNPMKII